MIIYKRTNWVESIEYGVSRKLNNAAHISRNLILRWQRCISGLTCSLVFPSAITIAVTIIIIITIRTTTPASTVPMQSCYYTAYCINYIVFLVDRVMRYICMTLYLKFSTLHSTLTHSSDASRGLKSARLFCSHFSLALALHFEH